MAVTGHKIYVTGNIAYIDQIVDSGSAMQFEGLAKNCLHRKKYTNSTEFSFSGFNGLDETKAFPFAQLKDGNGDAWADQATFEAWATSNLGKPSAGDSALKYRAVISQSGTDAPTVDHLRENTLGFEPEWDYSDVGVFGFNMPGINLDKVDCFIGSTAQASSAAIIETSIDSDFAYTIRTYIQNGITGVFELLNDALIKREITIIVNP